MQAMFYTQIINFFPQDEVNKGLEFHIGTLSKKKIQSKLIILLKNTKNCHKEKSVFL